MSKFRSAAALFALVALAACSDPVAPKTDPKSASPASVVPQTPEQTYLYAHALYGEPVFDRDVVTFQAALTKGLGEPASARLFGYTDDTLQEPSAEALTAAISELADQAIDGNDLIVAMFTTHGRPEFLAQKPADTEAITGVSAAALSRFLSPLQSDRQIIILQACFSGSLIDDLAGPNRIIMTAAAEDRSSFGCSPDNDNTFYIKALNAAIARGGNWSQIHERTVANVAALERAVGIPPEETSNPQVFVGANMIGLWGKPLATAE